MNDDDVLSAYLMFPFHFLILFIYLFLKLNSYRPTYQRKDWARGVVAIRCSRTWRPYHLNAVQSGRCTLFSNPFPGYPVQPVDRLTAVRRSLLSRCLQRTLGRKTPIVAFCHVKKKEKKTVLKKKKKSNCFNSNFHLLFISFDLKIFFDLFSSLFPCQSSCSPLENNWPALLIDQITPRNNPFLFLKERFSFFFTWNSLCLAIDGPVAADGQIQNRSQSYFLCL